MRLTSKQLFPCSIIFVVALLLIFGYYLEHYQKLVPCPLCILQRICYLGVLTSALLNLFIFKTPKLSVVPNIGMIFFSLLGLIIAGRHVWLQRFADSESLECLPSLEFLFTNFPLRETIYKLYLGGAECAHVDWTFLGGSIADWSALFFFGLFASTGVFTILSSQIKQTGTY